MNSRNERLALWLVIAVAIIALATPRLRSQSANNQQSEHFQRSFTLATGGTLEVENYKGTIHITGSDSNQVAVDVTKQFEGSDDDRKWWMENVQVNFSNDANRVAIEVKYPQQNCVFCMDLRQYTGSVELEIHVPRQINVKLETYKPDVKIASIQGDIQIKSYKSPIEIDSTTGAVRIDTYKETVRLRNVTIHGPLEIKSYKADTEIDARSLGDRATLENEKGSIILRVPASTGLNVEFEGSRRSSFSSDFPMTAQTGSFHQNFHGTVNQGGTRLQLRTGKGTVSLEKLSAQL